MKSGGNIVSTNYHIPTSSSAIAETALQGGSVLANSGRQYSADNTLVGLSSTTVT